MIAQITIKGNKYKVVANFLAFKYFAKKRGLKKISEVTEVLDGFGKLDSADVDFQMFDDLAMFMTSCIEAAEGKPFEMSIDELQAEFMEDKQLLKEFFETVNEAVKGDAEPGKSDRAKKKVTKA